MNFIETLREIENINDSFFELNKQIDVYRKKCGMVLLQITSLMN